MAWTDALFSHDRFIPLLTLVLLSFPVSYLTVLCHELGHGLVGLAQGSPFLGIFLSPNLACALVNNSPVVSVAGWLGQYVLATGAGLVSWKVSPRSFTARSLILIIVLANLIGVPFEIASLNGDSGNLILMLSPSVGASLVVAVLEGTAAALLIVGIYFSVGVARSYVGLVFPWITAKRSTVLALSLLVVAFAAANEILGSMLPWIGLPLLVLFFVLGFSLIPTRPSSYPAMATLPSRATFAITIAVFLLTEAFTYLVLPITIPL